MPISRLAMAVLPILLVSSPFAQAASEVPDLDIGPSCRAAATAGISADRSEDACRRDENRARDELQRKWPGFAAAEQRPERRRRTLKDAADQPFFGAIVVAPGPDWACL